MSPDSTDIGLVPAPVLAWARRAGPARALRMARQKWEAGARGDKVVLYADTDEQERRDLGWMVGMTWQNSDQRLLLGGLRRALADYDVKLPTLLEALGGPLRDRPAELAAERDLTSRQTDFVRTTLVAAGVPPETAALAVDAHWLGRGGRALSLAERVALLWPRLPAAEGTLLAELAARTYGDPHALDRRYALGGTVLRLQQHARSGRDAGRIRDAFARRAAWSEVGVTYDRVSSLVLALNLPLPGDSIAARLCVAAGTEPVWLTLRMIPPTFELPPASLDGKVVRVCENPSVMEAAADRLGASSAPLVCTFGQVSVTAISLLQALVGAGADLLITGDRDESGISITAGLLARFPAARPWLPQVDGHFEEDRLNALLADLRVTPSS